MRSVAIALGGILLTGCASLGGDPLVDSLAMPTAAAGCANIPSTDHAELDLCNALQSVRGSGQVYINAASELDNAHVGAGGMQVLSALVLLGAPMFGANADTSSGATLAGVLGLGYRNSIRPEERRDILVDGARSMRCIAERGSVFVGQSGRGARLRGLADTASRLSSRMRLEANSAELDAGQQALAPGLLLALDDLDSAVDQARETANYIQGAAYQVQAARTLAEDVVLAELRAQRPDFGGLIDTLRAGAQSSGESEGGTVTVSDYNFSQAAQEARSLARDLRAQIAAGPGRPAFDAILTCVAQG